MKVNRRQGLACSSGLAPNRSWRQELKGDVYNIFPDIYDPKNRAFTLLGLIEATFFPTLCEEEVERIPHIPKHEVGHIILGAAMVTCEGQALATYILAHVLNFLSVAGGASKLLIPSFTVVGPLREVFILKPIADALDKLADARITVHEIVAHTMQEGWRYFVREYARRSIRRVVDDALLDENTVEGFLDIHEKLGPMGSCSIGHYALNASGLTTESSLERFKRAIAVARTFNLDRWEPIFWQGTDPVAGLVGYVEFLKHLDNNLPGHNMGRCPLAGACVPKALDTYVDGLTQRSNDEGNAFRWGERNAASVCRISAQLMREGRCGREEKSAQGNDMLPDSVLEILRWYNPHALAILGYNRKEAAIRSLPILGLIEHDNCDYKYTIGITREEKERSLGEISPSIFGYLMLEALLQQMIHGEGPLCLCYPHQPDNCTYKPLLQRLWDCTEPDPEWENNWKKPAQKPPCIE